MPVFQILILDPAKRSRCENALSLVHATRSFSLLWQDPHISEADLRVTDGTTTLEVKEQMVPAQSPSSPTNSNYRAYLVSLSGESLLQWNNRCTSNPVGP